MKILKLNKNLEILCILQTVDLCSVVKLSCWHTYTNYGDEKFGLRSRNEIPREYIILYL